MTTITEDYISFETAKLLKEKGFDEICYLGYNKNGEYVPTSNRCNSQIIQPDFCLICCPTLQMAMKWLREVHNINIDIVSVWNQKRFEYQVFIVTPENADSPYYEHNPYKSYEEACEAAIKYCLEHLI